MSNYNVCLIGDSSESKTKRILGVYIWVSLVIRFPYCWLDGPVELVLGFIANLVVDILLLLKVLSAAVPDHACLLHWLKLVALKQTALWSLLTRAFLSFINVIDHLFLRLLSTASFS
jgi:hypothetical protein